MLPRCAAALAWATLSSGCAQIQSSSTVRVIPKPGARPRTIGSPHGQVTARGVDVNWQQRGSTLAIEVLETRRCRELLHRPVVRVEEVERKSGGALYWEYGIAAATLGLGLAALIHPDPFSPELVNAQGERVDDLRSGYRIGGIFTGIGTIALSAAIYDTVRSRDSVYYVDAYEVDLGQPTECASPRSPMVDETIEVMIEPWARTATTDARGRVIFELPASLQGDRESSSTPLPRWRDREEYAFEHGGANDWTVPRTDTRAEASVRNGVIRIDPRRVVAFDLMVPFDDPSADDHRGTRSVRPRDLEPPRLGDAGSP